MVHQQNISLMMMVKVILEYILWLLVLEHTLTVAGTVDYENGIIKINSILITSVSNVDGSASTQFRLTVLPSSNDVIPVRNQLLEIDTVNTTVVGTVDQTATTGKGYTVTTTGGAGSTTGTATTTTTTVATTSSTATSSSY